MGRSWSARRLRTSNLPPSSVSAEEYNAISTIYFTELNQVLTGAKSGADAAAAMEEQMTPIMEDLGY